MSRGRQHFRRNIAPVLGALVLIGIGIGVWVLLGVRATREASESLHARFAPGAELAALDLPADGYAVFAFADGERRCATLSLQPDSATLLDAAGAATTQPRAAAAALYARALADSRHCRALDVLVFASRMPYHGRFAVRHADGRVTGTGPLDYGQ